MDDNNFHLIASLLIGLAAIVLLLLLKLLFTKRQAKNKRGNKIYLLGPKGCGKTRLFAQLSQPDLPEPMTVTSLLPAEYPIGKFTLVDTPGHPKLRPDINALVQARFFVLWITPSSLKEDVEYLLSVLTHVHKHQIPLYLITILAPEKIKEACEQAVTRIIKTGQDDVDTNYDIETCTFFNNAHELAAFIFQ